MGPSVEVVHPSVLQLLGEVWRTSVMQHICLRAKGGVASPWAVTGLWPHQDCGGVVGWLTWWRAIIKRDRILRRTGWEGKERELCLIREQLYAWGGALRPVRTQSRVWGWKRGWCWSWCLWLEIELALPSNSWKKNFIHRPWFLESIKHCIFWDDNYMAQRDF